MGKSDSTKTTKSLDGTATASRRTTRRSSRDTKNVESTKRKTTDPYEHDHESKVSKTSVSKAKKIEKTLQEKISAGVDKKPQIKVQAKNHHRKSKISDELKHNVDESVEKVGKQTRRDVSSKILDTDVKLSAQVTKSKQVKSSKSGKKTDTGSKAVKQEPIDTNTLSTVSDVDSKAQDNKQKSRKREKR